MLRAPSFTRMSLRIAFLLLFLLVLLPCEMRAADYGPDPALVPPEPLAASRQLLVVEAPDWDATRALLRRYQRTASDASWALVGDAIPVNLGRAGLAWSRGFTLAPKPEGPVKREGDGKAPAGLFRLPTAFAYAPAELNPTAMPVQHATPELFCIDDPKSGHYNRMLRVDPTTQKDWDSAEDMLRKDEQYRYGLVVDHNHEGMLPEGGSCIFLHIWSSPEKPTAGCTAMAPAHLLALIRWLNPAANPLLLQMTTQGLAAFAARWKLPPP
jgi:L,D-peptidoglycan transpeptidase YkuD (ErfK/YbiS/YcfS/YnhG family)